MAKLTLEDSNTKLEWTITPSTVVQFVTEPMGIEVKIEAVSEGRATLTVITANELVTITDIIVTDNYYVCDGIDVMNYSPDYITVIARNVKSNPILTNDEMEEKIPAQVSLYCWSTENKPDVNVNKLFSSLKLIIGFMNESL